MKGGTQVLTAASLLVLTACTATKRAAALNPPSMQMAKQFKFQKLQTFQVNYLLFLPKDYDAKSGKRWPWILFLHAAGERGTNIWKVATHGPPKNVKQHPEVPFIVLSPQCPDGQVWSHDSLLALLDEVTRDYAVDASR